MVLCTLDFILVLNGQKDLTLINKERKVKISTKVQIEQKVVMFRYKFYVGVVTAGWFDVSPSFVCLTHGSHSHLMSG